MAARQATSFSMIAKIKYNTLKSHRRDISVNIDETYLTEISKYVNRISSEIGETRKDGMEFLRKKWNTQLRMAQQETRWEKLFEMSSSWPFLCHVLWHITIKSLNELSIKGKQPATKKLDKINKEFLWALQQDFKKPLSHVREINRKKVCETLVNCLERETQMHDLEISFNNESNSGPKIQDKFEILQKELSEKHEIKFGTSGDNNSSMEEIIDTLKDCIIELSDNKTTLIKEKEELEANLAHEQELKRNYESLNERSDKTIKTITSLKTTVESNFKDIQNWLNEKFKNIDRNADSSHSDYTMSRTPVGQDKHDNRSTSVLSRSVSDITSPRISSGHSSKSASSVQSNSPDPLPKPLQQDMLYMLMPYTNFDISSVRVLSANSSKSGSSLQSSSSTNTCKKPIQEEDIYVILPFTEHRNIRGGNSSTSIQPSSQNQVHNEVTEDQGRTLDTISHHREAWSLHPPISDSSHVHKDNGRNKNQSKTVNPSNSKFE